MLEKHTTLMQCVFVHVFALPRSFLLCSAALVLVWWLVDYSGAVTPRDTFPVANNTPQTIPLSEEAEKEAPLPPGV